MEQQNVAKMVNFKQEKSKSQSTKLKVFGISQKYFATIGITSNLTHKSYPFNGIVLFGFLMLCLNIYCASMFIIFDAETFAEYTQSVYVTTLLTLVIFCLLIITLKVNNLFEFINKSDDIVNTTLKYSASKSIFQEAVRCEEKLCKIIIFIMVKLTPASGLLPFLIYHLLVYFTIDSKYDTFELPSPLWLPFDWRNPLGYLIAITFEYAMVLYVMLVIACFVTLGVASYLYIIASSKCIKGSLFSIGRCTNDKNNQNILDQLIEFIDFHSHVKQWLSAYSDIFEPFLTILFVWSLVTICGALLMIQLQILHHSDNLTMLSITIFEIIYAFGVLLIGCELCQRVNLAYDECKELIDQFEWYLFPTEIQRMLPFILTFVQQTIEVKCFGSAACDRETFKYTIKTSFSYFTVLRKFYD